MYNIPVFSSIVTLSLNSPFPSCTLSTIPSILYLTIGWTYDVLDEPVGKSYEIWYPSTSITFSGRCGWNFAKSTFNTSHAGPPSSYVNLRLLIVGSNLKYTYVYTFEFSFEVILTLNFPSPMFPEAFPNLTKPFLSTVA